MDELAISPQLVRQKVAVPTRSDWGVGTVLKVLATTVNGAVVHRITIQFPHGSRTLVSPPAKLCAPMAEVQRQQGWLESISGRTVDDRLRCLSDAVTQVLGTVRQRLAAIVPAYSYDENPKSLARWAREQTGIADPLSQWSRDELVVAFAAFCSERDAHLRSVAALLVHAEGREALQAFIAAIDDEQALRAVLEALRKPL